MGNHVVWWQLYALKDGEARTMWEEIGGRMTILNPRRYDQFDWSLYVCSLIYCTYVMFVAREVYGQLIPWHQFVSFLHSLKSDKFHVLFIQQFWRCHCRLSWGKRSSIKVPFILSCSVYQRYLFFPLHLYNRIWCCWGMALYSAKDLRNKDSA